MNELTAFLATQYEAELQQFRAALDGVPEGAFNIAPTGHSPAWHALHVADWLRLTVLQDRTPAYHHLGWEDKDWVQNMQTLPAPVTETAGKAAVLNRLDDISARVLTYLGALTPEDLSGMTFSPSAPTGERPRLTALGQHVRHIAYHRGQVQLGKKAGA